MRYLATAVSAVTLALLLAPAHATDFKTWVAGLSAQTTLGSTDMVPFSAAGGASSKRIPGNNFLFSGGDAGTPSAINLSNGTALPIGGTVGNLPFSRLGVTGSPTGSKFVRDDGVLAVPAGGGGAASAGAAGNIQISSDGVGGFGSFAPGAGVTSLLTTFNSANLRAALTDEVGTGAAYFVGGALGTPASATLTNATGLPVGGIASIAAGSLIGNPTGSGAVPGLITLGTNLSFSGSVLNAAGGGSLTVTDTHGASGAATTLSFGPGNTVSIASGTATVKPTNEITTSAAASYTVQASDANTTVHLTNASPAVTVSSAATLGAGYGASVQCDSPCTLTPSSGTINGAGSLSLAAHQTAALWSDGSSISAGIILAANPSGSTPAGSSGDFEINTGGAFGAFTPGVGIQTALTTPNSANWRAAITDETGTGSMVFATSPTLVTPNLGTPSALVLTNATGLGIAGGGTGGSTLLGARSSLKIDSRISSYGDASSAINAADHYVTLGSSNWTVPATYTLPATSTVNDGDTIEIADDLGKLNGQTLTLAVTGGDTLTGTSALNSAGTRAYCKANSASTNWLCSSGVPNSSAAGQMLIGQGSTTPGAWLALSGDVVSVDAFGAVVVGSIHGNTYPGTIHQNRIAYGSANFAVGEINMGNNALLWTNSSGVPSGSQTPQLGTAASVAGTLGLANGGASGAVVTIQNPSATTAYNWNLPATVGTARQVPASAAGGSNPMTWISPSGSTSTYANVTGTVTGISGHLATWDNLGNIQDGGAAAGGGNVSNSGTPVANQMALWVDATHVKGNANLTDDGSTLTATQAFALSGSISPTALAAQANDYAPSGNTTSPRLRLTATGSDQNLTGLAGGAEGIIKILYNAGAVNNIIVKDQSASSAATNRFSLGADITIGPGKTRAFFYDSTASAGTGRWTNFDFGGGNTGVTAGTYGSTSTIPTVAISVDGRIISASNATPALPASSITSGQLAKAVGGTAAATGSGAAKNLSMPYKLVEDLAQHTHTGDNTETLLSSCAIPAGTMIAGSSLRANMLFSRPGTQSGTVTVRTRYGTTNDTAGTQLASGSMGSTSTALTSLVNLYNRGASSQVSAPITNIGTSTSVVVATTVDTAGSTSYFVITGQNATTTDTFSLEALTCEILPPGGN